MSEIFMTAVITSLLTAAIVVMLVRVELRLDCESLGQFRLNDVVYTCTPQENDDE